MRSEDYPFSFFGHRQEVFLAQPPFVLGKKSVFLQGGDEGGINPARDPIPRFFLLFFGAGGTLAVSTFAAAGNVLFF